MLNLKQQANSRYILPIIVLSQFCCTSLWFAGNAVLGDFILNFNLDQNALGNLTSAVQFGFISGTLLFAILTIADRYTSTRVFFVNALLGAFFNLLLILASNTYLSILILRFFTGFFLAGIYPVGMKIAADLFEKSLGKALGFLVGALVLGTAFPHLLHDLFKTLPWKFVIIATSVLAIFGGTLLLLTIPSRSRKVRLNFKLSSFIKVFKNDSFKAAAFGYFGHMWELYTFWAFIPIILSIYTSLHPEVKINIPLLSFLIIAVGSIGCIGGGYISQQYGIKQTAFTALLFSGICCLFLPFLFQVSSPILFIAFLFFWGVMVVADSPLFSTLVAQNSATELRGTALTIVNCIGFAITILSIQLLSFLNLNFHTPFIFMVLALGPFFGLVALVGKKGFKD